MKSPRGLGRTMFASLAVPNYRRYFIGILTSNIGTWMTRTAVSWLVLVELTHQDMNALGWITGCMFAPSLLFSAWAGTLADRFPKKRIMMGAQIVMLLDATLLGVLVITGTAQLWMVFAITFLDGCAGSIDGPSRMAFVSEIVDRDMLPNAIGLNSTSFNGARLIGPGIAGLLIAAVGTGPVFIINALSFVVLIITLAGVHTRPLAHAQRPSGRRGSLVEGLRYVRHRPDILLLLVVGGMMGNFGFNFAISNPVMTVNVFGRGPADFGLLGSLMGTGTLVAALMAASRKRPRLRYIVVSLFAFTAFSLASMLAPTFEIFGLLLIPIGFAAITTMVTGNTLLQMSVQPEMRGRVMALWTLVLLGGSPIVGPLVGWIGSTFGARWTVGVGVVSLGITAVGVLWYLMAQDGVRVRLEWQERRPVWVVTHAITDDFDGPPSR